MTTPKSVRPPLAVAAEGSELERYTLLLYVAGMTPRSAHAIENIRTICHEHLEGRYELQVIDVSQQPELAKKERIVAAPTLVKSLPLPLRRIIGDMSDEARVLVGLGIVRLRFADNHDV